MSLSVIIHNASGEQTRIEIDEAQAQFNTYQDLLDYLSSQGHDVSTMVVSDSTFRALSSSQTFVHESPLYVVGSLFIAVLAQGQMSVVQVTLLSTVLDVRNALLIEGLAVDKLVYHGVLYDDSTALRTIPELPLNKSAADTTENTFTSTKHILVRDKDTDRETRLECYDYNTLRDLLSSYELRERRTLHNPSLRPGENAMDAQEYQLDRTLYELGIADDALLQLDTEFFSVFIRDAKDLSKEDRGVEVYIKDQMRVKDVKLAYSDKVADGLLPGDRLIFGSDEMDDELMVYKYGVKPNSSIIVDREDVTQVYCYYICSDCGNDVRLKNRDAVRCRECGHRILFKKRINKPCQYNCR